MSDSDTRREELRDKITALRRKRDAHQMDESDYADSVLQLINAECLALLERLEKQSEPGLDIYEAESMGIRTSVIEQAKKDYS